MHTRRKYISKKEREGMDCIQLAQNTICDVM